MIRKVYLLTVFMMFSLLGFSQYQLSNNSFDNWEEYKAIDKNLWRPVSWPGAANVIYPGFAGFGKMQEPTVFRILKSDDGTINGTAAMELKSYQVSVNLGISKVERVAPGMVSQAEFWNTFNASSDASKNDAGFYMNTTPAGFTGHPEALEVRIKSNVKGGDNNVIRIISWAGEEYEQSKSGASNIPKDNNKYVKEANKIIDTRWTNKEVINNWTTISIPIKYMPGKESAVSTKMNIVFSASNYDDYDYGGGAPVAGSQLWVDDFKFIYSAKIKNIQVNDIAIANFNVNTYEYNVTLGSQTTGFEVKADAFLGEKVTIQQATQLPGTATITVVAEDGSLTKEYRVNITKECDIIAKQTAGGTISTNIQSGTKPLIGSTITLTASPSVGYEFVSWWDGNRENPRQYKIVGNQEVSAIFKILTYTVTLPTGTGYLATAQSNSPVNHGGSYNFTITKDVAYSNAALVVKANDVLLNSATNAYTISDIIHNQTITVDPIAKNRYNVTVNASGNGTVTGGGAGIEHGSKIKLEAQANANYHFTKWNDENKENPRTVEVTKEITYTATFDIDQFTVTVGGGDNGTVEGGGTFDYGSRVELKAVPNGDYTFKEWNDGNRENPRIIESLSSNVTYTATFVQKTYTVNLPASGTGYTTTIQAGSSSPVNHNGSFAFKVNVDEAYSKSALVVKANDNKLQAVSEIYTISNIVENQEVSIAPLTINSYTVSWTNGTGYTIAAQGGSSSPVNYGGNYSFTVTKTPEYSDAELVVKVDGETVSAVNNIYTISNIKSDKVITVDPLTINTYAVTLPSGTGYTAKVKEGSISPVVYGGSYSFTIVKDEAYSNSTLEVKSIGKATSGSLSAIDGVYTVENITEDKNVTVSGLVINRYTVELPEGAGYTAVAHDGSSSPVTYDGSYSFTITKTPAYSNAEVVVKVDNTVLTPVYNVYTITNIKGDKQITVDPLIINSYTVELPTGIGYVATAEDTAVSHGGRYSFSVILSESHNSSKYNVTATNCQTVVRDGDVWTLNGVTGAPVISVNGITINEYEATWTNVTGATIEVKNGDTPIISGSSIEYGTVLTITATPLASHDITSLKINGKEFANGGNYTMIKPMNIVVTTAIKSYTITVLQGENGSITPEGPVTINHGASRQFTFIPADQYSLNEILIDGISVGKTTPYTLSNVTKDQTITATFKYSPDMININFASVEGIDFKAIDGYESPVNKYDDFKFTATLLPSHDKSTPEIKVNGTTITAVEGIYTIANIEMTQNITASNVNINTYTIAVIQSNHGTITPETSEVEYGTDKTFTITADANYHIVDVEIDGESRGAIRSFTFEDIKAAHEIKATFAIDTYTITVIQSENGAITPETSKVEYGAMPTYTITPNEGYEIVNILVDNQIVTNADGSYTFSAIKSDHEITAAFTKKIYTITVVQGENGTITPGTSNVEYGTNKTFTITPNEGYHISEVLVDNNPVTATSGKYTFEMVKSHHEITATFAIGMSTITVVQGENGTIAPETSDVEYGTDKTFTITPNEGYHISEVLVDDKSVGAIESYTFEDIKESHEITATFAINTYTITVTQSANGTITPETTNVEHGKNQMFTITPDANCHIVDVKIDEESKGAISSFTFEEVKAAHKITATFAIDKYTITVTQDNNGTITPETVSVEHGANKTFAITPATNYHITDVLVDDVSVGAVGSYTFENVVAEHTITALFAIDTYTITVNQTPNGTITPETVEVEHGTSKTFTITSIPNYHITDVKVDGVSRGVMNSFTFNDITSDHTIEASFAIDTYTITVTQSDNGTIAPETVNVNYGRAATFTITPNDNYHIVDVKVDGISVGNVASYTFESVKKDGSITAQFAINTYTITVTQGNNGTITPETVSVEHGTDKTFAITAAENYHVTDVLVDGMSVGAVESYTFENIVAEHTITATFAIDTYTVSVTQTANVVITPETSDVEHGTDKTFTIRANDGYHITDVLVDGVSVGIVESYTFENVIAVHTITATFAINTYTITVTQTANGVITPETSDVEHGTDKTFAIRANDGYRIADVLVDGVSVETDGSYTFDNITTTHNITATFVINTYTITATTDANGTITPEGVSTLEYGANLTYNIIPNSGYSIASILVDNKEVEIANSYTFSNITESHTINVTFKVTTYTVTAIVKNGEGTITPEGITTVNHGESLMYTISATEGHEIESIVVNGNMRPVETTYTFNNITRNNTIEVTFKKITGVESITEYNLRITSWEKTISVKSDAIISADVVVYDMAGRIIEHVRMENGELKVAIDKSGTYVVRVVSENKIVGTGKVIIR